VFKADKERLLQQKKQNEEEIASLEKALEALQEKVTSLQHIEEEYNTLKQSFDEVTKQEKELAIQKAQKEQSKLNITKVVEELTSDIIKKETAKAKTISYSQLQNWFEKHLLNLVATIEKQIMSKVYRDFNLCFSTWFNNLLEDEIITARLDDEFSPLIEQNGYETSVQNLSGGEKTALALAYRLALNKVINTMISTIHTKDIIILDEPTDGFSSEQLERVRDVLQELNMNQIIIVSHESQMESFVDHVIKIHKDEHVSVVL